MSVRSYFNGGLYHYIRMLSDFLGAKLRKVERKTKKLVSFFAETE